MGRKLIEDLVVIYISNMLQNEKLHWQIETAKRLSKYTKVVHISSKDEPIKLKDIVWKGQIWRVAKTLISLKNNNFTSWVFFELIPLNRFRQIKLLNYKINFLLLQLLLAKKIVVITSSSENIVKRIINNLNPCLVIGESFDVFSLKGIREMARISDCLISSSPEVLRLQKKYFDCAFQLSTGYFSHKFIKALSRKGYSRPLKKILCIATITWRTNFDLLFHLAKKLKDSQLIIIGPELFDFYVDQYWENQNKKAKEKWLKLKKLKNVKHISIVRQEDLLAIKEKFGVGIIPYNTQYMFNRHCHPIKLYHYFAMGIPVVSTKIKSILHYKSKYLLFAEKPQAFTAAVKKLSSVKLSPRERSRFLAIAKEHTYENKAKELKNIIKKLDGKEV